MTLEAVANEPHYHAWTLYQLTIPWPGFSRAWENTHQMAYIPERTPYRVRQTAAYQLPRFDAYPQYGKKGGMVLACDGGYGCPFFVDPDTGEDSRAGAPKWTPTAEGKADLWRRAEKERNTADLERVETELARVAAELDAIRGALK